MSVMYFDHIEIDEARVRALLQQQHPDLAGLALRGRRRRLGQPDVATWRGSGRAPAANSACSVPASDRTAVAAVARIKPAAPGTGSSAGRRTLALFPDDMEHREMG
jgi:hypothetical protein